jgi:hypothetical protein
MSRAWAFGALIALFSVDLHAEVAVATPVPREKKPKVVALRLAPEWSYRRFSDSEPSSTDKHYAASGIFGLSAHLDIYPFSERAGALHNLGLLGSYGRAVGLRSIDIDTTPPTEVGTAFYHFDAGLQYRFPSSTPFSFTLSAAYERWVFDFDDAVTSSPSGASGPTVDSTSPPRREVPTARYSLARLGGDAGWAVEWVRFLGKIQVMYPLSIAPLGDREPTAGGLGARAELGVAFDLSKTFAIDLRGDYTLFAFHLPSVPGRSDAPGSVLDQYFVTSLGLSLNL